MSNKRSIVLNGKKTSISLEPEFWGQVQAIAEKRGIYVSDFVSEINAGNPANLSSAVRVAVLKAAMVGTTNEPQLEHAMGG